jgi:hypothetical protein
MKGNKIWRFLNMETLKEEVSVDVEFHEYKFPVLDIDANGWPIPRKPASLTLPKPSRLLEHTADASRSDLTSQGATTGQILAGDRPDIKDIDTRQPSKRARLSSDLNRESFAPEERRGKASEPVQGSGDSDPTPGGSRRAETEAPNLPGRGEPPAPPVAVTRKRPARLEEPRLEELIFRPTRSGRIPRKTIFADSVVRLVSQLQAVHIEGDSSSLDIPAAPFEAITL